MEQAAVIECRDVFFSYNERQILADVNLTIRQNDSVCIVGPNGGGKTTLIKLVLGLIEPDAGEVRVFGHPPGEVRPHIGYVPQYASYDKQFPISVGEVVLMGRLGNSFSGRYTKADREQMLASLKEVDLDGFAGRPFSALSGGQRQRVLIARALVSGGEILILDEPTANIDREAEAHFYELLKDLQKRMTILMVTHDVGFAASLFNRIACVNREVIIHPTSELTGELIRNMYGGDLRMIRHDHICSTEGHRHG